MRDRETGHRIRHERRRCARDDATSRLEAHLLDAAIVDTETDGHAVAAQRVVRGRHMRGFRERPFVVRALAMLDRELVIEGSGIEVHRLSPPSICRARSRASQSASMSASVEYTPSDARAVAVTPKCSMTGCVQ